MRRWTQDASVGWCFGCFLQMDGDTRLQLLLLPPHKWKTVCSRWGELGLLKHTVNAETETFLAETDSSYFRVQLVTPTCWQPGKAYKEILWKWLILCGFYELQIIKDCPELHVVAVFQSLHKLTSTYQGTLFNLHPHLADAPDSTSPWKNLPADPAALGLHHI